MYVFSSLYMYIVVAVHSQDSMRPACVNAVLADMYKLYAVIQNWLLEHFIQSCLLLRNFQQMCIHA